MPMPTSDEIPSRVDEFLELDHALPAADFVRVLSELLTNADGNGPTARAIRARVLVAAFADTFAEPRRNK